MLKAFRKTAIGTLLLLSLLPLTGCQQVNIAASPQDQPGSFSFYDEVNFEVFPGGFTQQATCTTTDVTCQSEVTNDLQDPLIQAGWTANNTDVDGNLNGNISTTQASTIVGDTSNFIYMNSHGGVFGGQSLLCLWACDGSTTGGDAALDTSNIPNSWKGPNWLILDACDVVAPNQGWESKFGGNLHGILGFWTQESQTLGVGSTLGPSGFEAFTNDLKSYKTAITAWEDGVGATDQTPAIGMLVPSANVGDAIESSTGPHFGPNGSTSNILFYQGQPDGTIKVISPQGVPVTGTQPELVAQPVNESQWLAAYGNPSGTWTYPSPNEHRFVSTDAVVTHYLASGGIVAEGHVSGTAGAISQTQALQYAENWIAQNGGMPLDAVLAYAGHITNPNPLIITAAHPGIPSSDFPPYNNMRAWVFIWRHANGILFGDKMEAIVDDGGNWTPTTSEPIGRTGVVHVYWGPPWNPSPEIRLYSRVWRTLGATGGSLAMQSLPASVGSSSASTTGYCAPDMASTTTVATPCQQYTSGASGLQTFVSFSTGSVLGAH